MILAKDSIYFRSVHFSLLDVSRYDLIVDYIGTFEFSMVLIRWIWVKNQVLFSDLGLTVNAAADKLGIKFVVTSLLQLESSSQ